MPGVELIDFGKIGYPAEGGNKVLPPAAQQEVLRQLGALKLQERLGRLGYESTAGVGLAVQTPESQTREQPGQDQLVQKAS